MPELEWEKLDHRQRVAFQSARQNLSGHQLLQKRAMFQANHWAILIESWVKKNMHPTSDVGYARASTIVQDLKGDCRQHGMLTAALCRAAGIPARTALGLVYGHEKDKDQKWIPILGFHMWTEAWINGQWIGLDATLGKGGIGPGHLKISEHSWADTQTLAPLLPVSRAMGKLKVEIEEVEQR